MSVSPRERRYCSEGKTQSSGVLALCAVLGLGFAGSLQAMDLTTLTNSSAFGYDTSAINNPYLRSNNFYGFDKLDDDDSGGLGGILGDLDIPLIANVGISPFYNDNVLYNNQDRKTAYGSNFSPSLILPFGNSKIYTVLSYTLNATVYEGLSYANTTSNFLNATTAIEFDHRNHLVVSARGMPYAQDALGTYFSQGNAANTLKTPNTWTGYGFDGSYRLGGDTAKGNLLLNAAVDNHVYQNNPQYTRSRSLEAYTFGSSFLWRALPKTQFILEANDTMLNYLYPTSNGATYSGDLYRAYTGFAWEVSSKTRLVLKGGYQVHTYDYSGYKTQTGPAFQGMLRWQPAARDTVWAEVIDSLNEGYIGSATAASTQSFSVNWGHNWLERFRTQFTANYMNQKYTNSNVQYQTMYGSISAIYTIHQGMWLDLRYNYTNRTANETQNAQYNYNQDLLVLSYRVMF